jgi:hypothetical protein
MSSLANLRLISQTPTSVTLGVTTDSFAGDLYVGMRTSGPYSPTGDETTIIADAVGTIPNPAYGEQTFTVGGLSAGTQYYFGAVQQYGYDHADMDYTFEASRPLSEENLQYYCQATRHVVVDGIIQQYPPDTPVYTQGGLLLVPSYHQIIPDANREDFSTWTAVGCSAVSAPTVTPYPGRAGYRITDTGGDADAEVSLTLSGLTTSAAGATNAYHIFNVFIYAPVREDQEEVWVQLSNPVSSKPSKTWFNATAGVIASSTNEDGLKVARVYQCANGWFRVEHHLHQCLDADPITLQIKIVSGDAAETIVRDGTNEIYLFGANCSRLWYTGTYTDMLDRDRQRGWDYLDGFGDILCASYVLSNDALPGVSSQRDMACGMDITFPDLADIRAVSGVHENSGRMAFCSSITAQAQAINFDMQSLYFWTQQWFGGVNSGFNVSIGRSTRQWYRALYRMSHKTLIEGVDTEAKAWFNALTGTQAAGTNPIETTAPITRLVLNHHQYTGATWNVERSTTMIVHRAFFWNVSPGDQFLEDMYGTTITFSGVSNYLPAEVVHSSAVNRTVDARNLMIRCGNSTHQDVTLEQKCAWTGGTDPVLRYPFTIRGGQSNAKVYGCTFFNRTPNHTLYSPTYNDDAVTCNSTNTYWYPVQGPNCELIGERHLGGWDCVNPPGGQWTDSNYYSIVIDRMYATLTRDDVIEADGGSSYLLKDSLLDGVGPLSSQPASNPPGGSILIQLHDVLFRTHLCPGNYNYEPHDGVYQNTIWNPNSNGNFVKAWDATNLTYEFINVSFAVALLTHTAEVNCTSQWDYMLARQNGNSTGNRLLWLSVDPPPDHFSTGLDPAWTLVTGQTAVDEWIAGRDAWLAQHGGLIPIPGEDTESPEWQAKDAAYRQQFTERRTEFFAGQYLPLPPQGYDPELGFTDGPTSGTWTLTDYGFNLGLYQLRRSFTVGLSITPSSSNMNGAILTMAHIVISVAGDVWSMTTESGITVSVTSPYSAGVKVLLRCGACSMGGHWLRVDAAYDDDTGVPGDAPGGGSARSGEYLWNTPVVTGTFGAFTVTKFRLAPFQYRDWYTQKYWAGD